MAFSYRIVLGVAVVEARPPDDFAGVKRIKTTPIRPNMAAAVRRPLRSLAGWIAINTITVA
jgi:hypothetical protein